MADEVTARWVGPEGSVAGRVRVELSWADAEVLSVLLGRTFNGPDDGPRGVAGAVYNALDGLGVREAWEVRFARYGADRAVESWGGALVTVWDDTTDRPEWLAAAATILTQAHEITSIEVSKEE